jgi:GntR family transcriptional regulator/MocR family aminotransferase
MRNPQRLSVPILLERDEPAPLQDQLAAQLRQAIIRGQLAAGTRMPSTRTLSGVLEVSRGVALAAYELLLSEGYIAGRRGSGTYVSAPAVSAVAAVSDRSGPDRSGPDRYVSDRSGPDRSGPVPTLTDLSAERPSMQAFPLAAWRAAWRRASHQTPPVEEPPAAGLPELRQAIAAHLRETRGLVLDQHEVVVTAGYGHAVHLLLRAWGGLSPIVGLEEPAPVRLRSAFRRHSIVLPLATDASGARPDLIPAACDVVAVMPERNSPLGWRMPTERRLALAEWACEHDGLVLEPAFDGLFDTGLNPRPSIMAVGDPARTAMVGSFCDVLTPTLRLAYAVVPRHLAAAMAEGLANGHGQPSFTCQLAVADLLGSGCVSHRAERLSSLYAPKRALVRQALGTYPDTRLLGADTGAAATLLLPGSVSAESVIRTLRQRQVKVADLNDFYDGSPGNGIVLCYAHLDTVTLRRALRTLAQTLDDHHLARRTAA